tara:strand:+ start:888 stop:1292 length:405 start_codon:yes stop_codon:yes gene_type:complete
MPDGTIVETEIMTPSHAVEPGTLVTDDMQASTGSTQGLDQALSALSSSTSWPAMGLILAGVVSLCLSLKFPILPRSTSFILIAAGVGLLAFPVLLDRYAWIVMVALVVIGGLWIYGLWDNRKKLLSPPPPRKGK